MKFPRKEDNSLNFEAFFALNPKDAREAATDLRDNGTETEKQLFTQKMHKIVEEAEALKAEHRALETQKQQYMTAYTQGMKKTLDPNNNSQNKPNQNHTNNRNNKPHGGGKCNMM